MHEPKAIRDSGCGGSAALARESANEGKTSDENDGTSDDSGGSDLDSIWSAAIVLGRSREDFVDADHGEERPGASSGTTPFRRAATSRSMSSSVWPAVRLMRSRDAPAAPTAGGSPAPGGDASASSRSDKRDRLGRVADDDGDDLTGRRADVDAGRR